MASRLIDFLMAASEADAISVCIADLTASSISTTRCTAPRHGAARPHTPMPSPGKAICKIVDIAVGWQPGDGCVGDHGSVKRSCVMNKTLDRCAHTR
jgi:hypothetical protein